MSALGRFKLAWEKMRSESNLSVVVTLFTKDIYLSHHRTKIPLPRLLLAQEAVGVEPQPLDAVVPHGDAGPLRRQHPLFGQHDGHAGRAVRAPSYQSTSSGFSGRPVPEIWSTPRIIVRAKNWTYTRSFFIRVKVNFWYQVTLFFLKFWYQMALMVALIILLFFPLSINWEVMTVIL